MELTTWISVVLDLVLVTYCPFILGAGTLKRRSYSKHKRMAGAFGPILALIGPALIATFDGLYWLALALSSTTLFFILGWRHEAKLLAKEEPTQTQGDDIPK